MSEPTQAERLAALQAKRAPTPRAERDTNPSTQRVVAAGVSVVSFAAITLAMGPLTAPSETVDAGADNVIASDDGVALSTTAQVPEALPDVVVEVVPHYVPVTEDGTPLPADMLQDDGTLADAPPVAPATTVAPTDAVPTTSAATATTSVAEPAAATPTTAPTTTGAPASIAAPTTVAAPTTTAAPPPPPRSEASG